MEPLALVLAAFGALGASALPSLLVVRKRAAALFERLSTVNGVPPRMKGSRLTVDAITSLGAVRVEVAPGVLGNRWRLSAPLAGYGADERVQLYPGIEHLHRKGLVGADLGRPKKGLPKLPPRLRREELRYALETALPELARGSYPVISHGEAAWLVRLLLHPASDRELADEVAGALEGFHITPKASRVGFDRVLAFLRGEVSREDEAGSEELGSLLLALELRFQLSRVTQAGWSPSSCVIGGSTLSFMAQDRGVAPAEELRRRFETFAALARMLADVRGGSDRVPCPSCRLVFLDPPKGELSERECAHCHGRLLDREALRRLVLDPLGKSPGELSEAARGARGQGAICPSCARAMSPVLLDRDVIADLCVGCGSTWLEEGELSRLSRGLYGG